MKHRANPRFWRCYRGLPKDVQALADKGYALLKANPTHLSLHFKMVAQFEGARAGLMRSVGPTTMIDADGTHDEVEGLSRWKLGSLITPGRSRKS